MGLITKEKCYVQSNCKKYKNDLCLDDFCVRLYKIDALYNNALLTDEQKYERFLKPTTEQDNITFMKLAEYKSNIIDFVNTGKNIYLYSTTTGNGKTSWALKFVHAYISKIWAPTDLVCRCLFISVPKYTRELKLNIDEKSKYVKHINDNVLSADLVIWDDIATKNVSEYELEQLLSIIDSRINSNKSNIFTSNVPPDNLVSIIGQRLASRIKNLSEAIEIIGSDQRGLDVK